MMLKNFVDTILCGSAKDDTHRYYFIQPEKLSLKVQMTWKYVATVRIFVHYPRNNMEKLLTMFPQVNEKDRNNTIYITANYER